MSDEQAYAAAKQKVIDALVELLTVADELEKDQQLVAAEVLLAFQQAVETLAA